MKIVKRVGYKKFNCNKRWFCVTETKAGTYNTVTDIVTVLTPVGKIKAGEYPSKAPEDNMTPRGETYNLTHKDGSWAGWVGLSYVDICFPIYLRGIEGTRYEKIQNRLAS